MFEEGCDEVSEEGLTVCGVAGKVSVFDVAAGHFSRISARCKEVALSLVLCWFLVEG